MQGTHLIFELLFTSLFISLSAGVFSGTVLVSSPFSLLSFPWQSHPCHGFQVLLSVPSKFPSPAHSTAGIYVQLPVELNMSTTVLIISLPPNILLSLCSLSQGMVPPTSPESQKPGTALDTSLFLTTPIKNPPQVLLILYPKYPSNTLTRFHHHYYPAHLLSLEILLLFLLFPCLYS